MLLLQSVAHLLLTGVIAYTQVTLLAAGFVIGPSGHSIRAICEKSGANVQACAQCLSDGVNNMFEQHC